MNLPLHKTTYIFSGHYTLCSGMQVSILRTTPPGGIPTCPKCMERLRHIHRNPSMLTIDLGIREAAAELFGGSEL